MSLCILIMFAVFVYTMFLHQKIFKQGGKSDKIL